MKRHFVDTLEKILASILLVAVIAGNLIVIGTRSVSYAKENLEAQNELTEHRNVKFGAYFSVEGVQAHSIKMLEEELARINMHIAVEEGGYLKDGVIELENENFVLARGEDKAKLIAKAYRTALELKQIESGTDANIGIDVALNTLPDEIAVADLDRISAIVLRGIYVTQFGEEIKINKKVYLNLEWESSPRMTIESELKTNKKYETDEGKGTIIEEKIEMIKAEGKLPIKQTRIEVEVPKLEEKELKDVRVRSNGTEMTNGKKENEANYTWNYDAQEGKITIVAQNEEKEGLVWNGKEGVDNYIVTYDYIEKETNNTEQETNEIEELNTLKRKSKITIENYVGNNIEEIIEKEESILEEKGSLVYGKIEIANEINKAKMYANAMGETKDFETEYSVKETVEIAKAIEEIRIEEKEENFVEQKENEEIRVEESKYLLTREGVDSSYYKATKIAKENFENILGEDGYILIKNEAGEEIGKITKASYEKDGKLEADYEANDNIIIETSIPKSEGIIIFEHTKEVKGNINYSNEELHRFNKIETVIKINDQETIGRSNLFEAKNYLRIETNKQELNEKEEDIEIKVALGNNKEDSILYENPTLKIVLPNFVENISVNNVSLLFEDELEIANTEVAENDNGGKEILIHFTGKQTKFGDVAGNETILVVNGKLVNKNEKTNGEIKAAIAENDAIMKITSNVEEIPNITIGETLKELVRENNLKTVGEPQTVVETEKEKLTLEMELKGLAGMSNVKDYKQGDILYILIKMTKAENAEIKNLILTDILPEGLIYERAAFQKLLLEDGDEYETLKTVDDFGTINYDQSTKRLTLQVNELTDEEIYISLYAKLEDIESEHKTKTITNYMSATFENGINEVKSNEISISYGEPSIQITQTTENLKNINQIGDTVKFIIEAKNEGASISEPFDITISLPNGVTSQKVVQTIGEQTFERNVYNNNIDITNMVLNAGENMTLEFNADIVGIEEGYKEQYKTLNIIMKIGDEEFEQEIIVKNPSYVEPENPTPTEPENPTPTEPENPTPTEPENPTPTEPENPTPTEPEKQNENNYSISGIAWVDENEDGIKQVGEELLKNIKVKLIGTDEDKTEIEKQTTTNEKGKYIFSNLEKGKYQVVFEIDNTKYKLTQYLKTNTPEINSSVIQKNSNEAITNIIEIINEDILNVNIGLLKELKFDMSIDKKVSKITVTNSSGTKNYDYGTNGTELAKLDINGKYLTGTTVLVEYKITVKNEGELAGKVTEIVDYLPKDMQFTTDLNKNWIQSSDGYIYNRSLKDITIKPGETKEITLVLRRKMTNANTGLIHNTAEISKVENSKNLNDIDSTPKNKVQREDDISSADVLIGVQTGQEVIYITLGTIAMIILAVGIILINRKVLK